MRLRWIRSHHGEVHASKTVNLQEEPCNLFKDPCHGSSPSRLSRTIYAFTCNFPAIAAGYYTCLLTHLPKCFVSVELNGLIRKCVTCRGSPQASPPCGGLTPTTLSILPPRNTLLLCRQCFTAALHNGKCMSYTLVCCAQFSQAALHITTSQRQLQHQRFTLHRCEGGETLGDSELKSMPSAPMGVVATGRPCAHESTTFPFSPAPNRSGARHTRKWRMTPRSGVGPRMCSPLACMPGCISPNRMPELTQEHLFFLVNNQGQLNLRRQRGLVPDRSNRVYASSQAFE